MSWDWPVAIISSASSSESTAVSWEFWRPFVGALAVVQVSLLLGWVLGVFVTKDPKFVCDVRFRSFLFLLSQASKCSLKNQTK